MRLLVACLVGFAVALPARTSRADPVDGDAGAPTPAHTTDTAQSHRSHAWDLGVRPWLGGSYVTKVSLCLDAGSCPSVHDTYDVYGARVYASVGGPTATQRWQNSLEVFLGPDRNRRAFGTMTGARLLTGVQSLSDRAANEGLLWELGGGLSYFRFSDGYSSLPMLAVSAAIGGRTGAGEVVIRAGLDTWFALETVISIVIEVGLDVQP